MNSLSQHIMNYNSSGNSKAFRCDVDAQRTFREVSYLKALKSHENIIEIEHVMRADNDRDLYIMFEHVETDLSHVIKARILEPIVSCS